MRRRSRRQLSREEEDIRPPAATDIIWDLKERKKERKK
jgi:hypothetical protein